MTPLDLIKNGLLEGDWDLVSSGYEQLTGQKIRPVGDSDYKKSRDKAINALKKIITTAVENMDGINVSFAYDQLLLDRPSDEQEKDDVEDEDTEEVDEQESYSPSEEEDDESEEEEARPQTRLERARMAADERVKKYTVKHGVPKGTEGTGRNLPWEPPSGPNKFVPNDAGISPDDIKTTEILNKTVKRTPPRPPIKKVKAECCKCEKTFDVHPTEAPKKIGDEWSLYVCDRCLGGSKRSR